MPLEVPPRYLREGVLDNPKTIPLKELLDTIREGMVLRFKLRANPTRKTSKDKKRQVIKGEAEQLDWLVEKARKAGFDLVRGDDGHLVTITREWNAKAKKQEDAGVNHAITFGSVVFEGYLTVVSKSSFVEALKKGIGTAKGFGFGLITVAPPS